MSCSAVKLDCIPNGGTTPATSTPPAAPATPVVVDCEIANRPDGKLTGTATGQPIVLQEPVVGTPVAPKQIELGAGVRLDPVTGAPFVGDAAPATWAELGSQLYDVASVIDGQKQGNLFAQLSLEQRAKLLGYLSAAVDGKAFDGEPGDMLDDKQRTQLRSSSATVVCELMASLMGKDEPRAQRILGETVQLAVRQAKAEKHIVLRESMAWGLYRYTVALPEELAQLCKEVTREVCPVRPPYEAWLADGKVVFDLTYGDSESYRTDAVGRVLRRHGFDKVSGSANNGVYKGKVGTGDNEVEIEIRTRVNSWSDDIFKNVGKSGVDVVLYTGHSSYGRNIPNSLDNADEVSGHQQLLWIETCFGKANLHEMRREFPRAHIMTTFNSASTSGDFAPGLDAIITGIANRWDYEKIDEAASRQTMTPIEVLLRRRYIDRDGDGRADIFDRLFDVNLHQVDRDLKHAFEGRDPGAMPHHLQSLYGVTAANWCNRGIGAYNQAVHRMNRDSRVWSKGFFEGKAGDAPVRFERTTLEDGKAGWAMTLNHRFAHVPEAVLRVIAAHEFNACLSRSESYDFHGDHLRTNVNSLLGVAFTLSHDRDQNDGKIFEQFLEAYGFPKELDLDELEEFCEKNSADLYDEHGGNRTNVDAFIAHLREDEPELLEALKVEGAGEWQGA